MDTKEKHADEQTLRLLKKGRKGIFAMIFSRTGLVLLLLVLNICWLLAAFSWFSDFIPHIFGTTALFTLGMVIILISSNMEPTVKIAWLFMIMLLPVFGSLFYLFTQMELGHRMMKRRLGQIYSLSAETPLQEKAEKEEKTMDPGALSMTKYVRSITGIPLYANTRVQYFPCGEALLEPMLDALRSAEKTIYIEYFIVEEGVFWGRILEILSQKAAMGVDVRVIYDGTCEFTLLPKSYPKKLKSLGISCRVFAPVTPFVSTHYNYRDHRKILTVDGKVAFTGGINLADEYINETERFGYWKDTAIMMRGDAAQGFERMFLQMWNLEERNPAFSASEEAPAADGSGLVMPYYENPLDGEHIGRQVYMDMLARAKKYVHIMTPYLIIDSEMESALKYAAKRGVDVKLLLPGIPDKKLPFALAKSHYKSLLKAGVRIYEYTPGFVHAKVVVADDMEAVVGTINFDYRSLYHHFECAAYLYDTPCIEEIRKDFSQSLTKAKEITLQGVKKEKLFYKVMGTLLKVIAPLC